MKAMYHLEDSTFEETSNKRVVRFKEEIKEDKTEKTVDAADYDKGYSGYLKDINMAVDDLKRKRVYLEKDGKYIVSF